MIICFDNCIWVWDNLCVDLFELSCEIVYSYNFNRYIMFFKVEWDFKDWLECLVVIGCYISDNFSGVVLYFIDFIDMSDGWFVE